MRQSSTSMSNSTTAQIGSKQGPMKLHDRHE
jgi:hypothetical protein